jgi:hypothetical protein
VIPTPAQLAKHHELLRWLKSGAWTAEFTPSAAEEAFACACQSITLDRQQTAGLRLAIIDSLIRDERPHPARTRLSFIALDHDSPLFKTSCSCGENRCRHAYAILETIRRIAAGEAEPAAEATQASGPRTKAAVTRWLLALDDDALAAHAPPPQPTATPPPPPPPQPAAGARFLAYCLVRQAAGAPLRFVLRIGTRQRHGWAIDRDPVNPDLSKSAKILTPADLAICKQLVARNRQHQLKGTDLPLLGPGWTEIVTAAMATGRMFLEDADGTPAGERRLSAGAPLEVEPTWKPLAGGAARPTLSLPAPAIQLIGIEPLHYLDPMTCQVGPLRSRLADAILRQWIAGPPVPADLLADLGERFAKLRGRWLLPLPGESPPLTLSDASPSPVLRITEVRVGIFQKRHLGGLLELRYPGSPPFFPLAESESPDAGWFDDQSRRILCQRNRAAELALAKQLADHGLTPLHEIANPADLNPKNHHSVVLGSPRLEPAEWLEFLGGPTCQALRNAGWTIETDPALHLTVRDVTAIAPAIETEAGGGDIDWFRFDVTGEFEGKRISLIPQIARAIADDWVSRYPDLENLPDSLLLPCEDPADGHIRFPARRFMEILHQVRHLFHDPTAADGPMRLDRVAAAGVADGLAIDASETHRALAALGRDLRDIRGLPPAAVPESVRAVLRPYQTDGFRWLRFLQQHALHGILADDMGLGKTLQTLSHLAAGHAADPGTPSLVIAPTSVVPNWAAEAKRFIPSLKVLVLHGSDRADDFARIPASDIVFTSYPLLVRDFEELSKHAWHIVVLDEAQTIKNPKSLAAKSACGLRAAHRVCLSGTPMENHLGELWSLMRFLMPGFLGDERSFNERIRKPVERQQSAAARLALQRRIAPLILRRTKDQVADELPGKTVITHGIDLAAGQVDLYESIRAAMDERVRGAIAAKGWAKSHIIVLDALLKLRQVCCHPGLLKGEYGGRVRESAKLEFLTTDLLPTLIEEGRRILLFSQFTSMLALIGEHLVAAAVPHLKLTGQTKDRAGLVERFQSGDFPVFLISLKAGGTGLNLTAADTVIHYDPWWNPAAENQATDRAHRIGQTKPVFIHKLVCRGTIEERILELQQRKSALVEALLSDATAKLRIDAETLSHLFAPLP